MATSTKTKKAANKKEAASDTAHDQAWQKALEFIGNTLEGVQQDIKRVKTVVAKLAQLNPSDAGADQAWEAINKTINPDGLQSYSEEDIQIVEGTFDGYFMIGGDQKKYPVPLNYSSKTKLVCGDKLKLRIMPEGKLVYKLIGPVEREHQKATLSLDDDHKPIALTADGKTYFLNHAAVTYFKGKAGDELYIMTNKDGSGAFAAIEAIMRG